jgi:Mitochondrial ribosomal protein subunit
MATPARLSPAANLLRNSKLFALPSAIPLPPSKPTAEPVAGSETQTTIYPTRAAIVTPHATLLRGDWGLKRALPLKSTTNTSTPSIRLNKDIDSADHVADFESAADHVQTYAKWQDVPIMMTHRPKWVADPNIARYDGRTPSVFHPDLDNGVLERPELENMHNTDQSIPPHLRKSLEQLKSDRDAAAQASGQPLPRTTQAPKTGKLGVKRWRYGGPWLAGMSEIEFEAYLKHLSTERIASFREHLATKVREIKASRVTVKADQQKQNPIEVTDKEITDAVRKLRQDPQAFGPEIAQFLDLPEGPMKPSMVYNPTRDHRVRLLQHCWPSANAPICRVFVCTNFEFFPQQPLLRPSQTYVSHASSDLA